MRYPYLFRFGGWLLRAAAGLSISGCDLFEFSPNDTVVPDSERHLTAKNLARLAAQPPAPGDTLRFVLTGDSQRFYEEADALVASINQQPGLDFVLVAGDISDFGLSRELAAVGRKLNRLTVPYFTVIGNHDQVANGRKAYEKVFGPLNYSFTYGPTQVVCIDTNGREYAFNGQVPDVNWLRRELNQAGTAQSVRRRLVLFHVPPYNEDFDPALVQPFHRVLAEQPDLALALNGHDHSYKVTQPFDGRVTYVNSDSFEQRRYVIVTLWGTGSYRLTQVSF